MDNVSKRVSVSTNFFGVLAILIRYSYNSPCNLTNPNAIFNPIKTSEFKYPISIVYNPIEHQFYHNRLNNDCYLDIYNCTDKQIVSMYHTKNSFCEYCREPIEGNKYSTSKKEKKEWM